MAIKLPARKYYTFKELKERFQCSKQDLRRLVEEEEITPSFYLCSAQYKGSQLEVGLGPFRDAEFSLSNMTPPCCEYLEGFYFLVAPDRWPASGLVFDYVSTKASGHQTGDIWFYLPTVITLDDVLKAGVVMADELARFEVICKKMETSKLRGVVQGLIANESEKDTKPNKRSRTHHIAHAIEAAKKRCTDPCDAGAVWAELVSFALAKSNGFIGKTDKGVHYLDANDESKEFSKRQLTAYLAGSNLNRKR